MRRSLCCLLLMSAMVGIFGCGEQEDLGAPKGMVLIPAGEFEMGTSPTEIPELVRAEKRYIPKVNRSWFEDETPRHTVYLSAFYIDTHEITNIEYAKFMKATRRSKPFYWQPSKANLPLPVVGVTFDDALAYCEWIAKRLPTEAEWEKAARGGLWQKQYPWGDQVPDGTRSNFADQTINLDWSDKNSNDGFAILSPVGSYPPNGFGLYDMAGNVFNWCADWYDPDYYANSPTQNPRGPLSGEYHVLRGGSWSYPPTRLRLARRNHKPASSGPDYVGIRCAKSIEP